MSAVLDAFDAPATPEFRRERPALVRARLRWGARRLSAAREAVQGIAVGDRVTVELFPGATWTGHVVAWRRLPTATIAEVRLDPPCPLWPVGLLRRRRHLLAPIPESTP